MVVFPYIGSENLAICYLSGMLRAHGIKTKLAFEPSLFDDTKYLHIPAIPRLLKYNERFANYIVSLKPKILAFSVFTMNYLWALDIAKRVKEQIDVPIVFGGVHVKALPEQVLANPQVDYIIQGEGDYALLELVQSLEKGEVDLTIRNLGYKRNSEIVLNPIRPLIENLDELPYPDRDMFAEIEHFRESVAYLCGRGCPYRCTFCANSFIRGQFPNPGKFVRWQSHDRCFEELKYLKKRFNPKTFRMEDDVFIINKKWLKEFCERYPKEVGVPFNICGYPSLVTEETIRMLKEAGCFFIQVGVQSLNPENRKNIIQRHESNQDVANCITWCNKYGMGISVDYIFFPWEANEADQLNAAHFFHENPPTRIANFYLSYLPGTPIIPWALKNGYLREEDLKDIEAGKNAYYHVGGEFRNQKEVLSFFNNFYNFFIFLIMFPKPVGDFLFKIRAYKYARFFPKTALILFKETLLPLFSSKFRESPVFIRYVKYYFSLSNLKASLLGQYGDISSQDETGGKEQSAESPSLLSPR